MMGEGGDAEQGQASGSAGLYRGGENAVSPAPRPAPGQALPSYPDAWHGPPEHPQAIAVLVLGIVGMTVVPLTAPLAWARYA